MRILYIIYLFTIFYSPLKIIAQREGHNWYFSKNAGLNFNSTPPSVLANGALNTADNSAAISDSNGNILFYSDGITVYNKNHNPMPSGTGLLGSFSGGQSVLIIPIPRNPTKYIVFSVPDVGNKPLSYSIVNMSLNNGLGDVEQKNIFLYDNTTEKIAAVYNCEIEAYWVITHKYESDQFYIYQIDKNGLNPNPKIQSIGKIHSGGPIGNVNNSAGQMSISKDGSKLALGLYWSGDLEIFDFDISTAQISNYRNVSGIIRIWGVEFSDDASKLYTSQWTLRTISQFDLSNPNAAAIKSSQTIVGNANGVGGTYYAGYLQRAPDNKIYIAQWNSEFLSTIDKPNLNGSLCQFNLNAINISPGSSLAGLCRIVYPEKELDIKIILNKDTAICLGKTLVLKSNFPQTKWSTGEISESIVVNSSGKYWAEIAQSCKVYRDSVLVSFTNCDSCYLPCDTIAWPEWKKATNIEYRGRIPDGSFKLLLDPNTGLQYPIFNDVNLSNPRYTPNVIPRVPTPWMPGNSQKILKHKIVLDSLIVDSDVLLFLGEFPNERKYTGPQTGKLRIYDKNQNKLTLDSLCLLFRDARFIFSTTKIQYKGDEIWFNVDHSSATDGDVFIFKDLPKSTYTIEVEHVNDRSWIEDGIYFNLAKPFCCKTDTFSLDSITCNAIIWHGKTYSQSGNYFVIKNNKNCDSIFQLNLTILKPPPLNILDTFLCQGAIITRNSISDSTIWSNGQTGKTATFDKPGIYWLSVNTPCGPVSDTFEIIEIPKTVLDLGPDITICPNTIDNIFSNNPNTLWPDGSVGLFHIIKKDGPIIASITDFCGTVTDTLVISYFPNSVVKINGDTIFCQGDSVLLKTNHQNSIWYDGSTGPNKWVSHPGEYWASISSPCGAHSDTINISSIPVHQPPYLPSDSAICQDSSFVLNIPGIVEIWNDTSLNSILVNSPGLYYYTFQDRCNDLYDSIQISYDSIPLALPIDSVILCGKQNHIFRSGNGQSLWSDGSIGPELMVSESGLYHYFLQNACGVFSDSAFLSIIDNSGLHLPNVFSPNGDQINDEFPGVNVIQSFHLEIYDRWGELLFEAENKHWNGEYRNKALPPGVYVYIISSPACRNHFKSGDITLLR